MQLQKIVSIFFFYLFIFSFFINAEHIENNLNNEKLSAKVEEVASEIFNQSSDFNKEFDDLNNEEKNELDTNINVLGKMAELFPEDLKKEVLNVWERANILFTKLENPLYLFFEVYKNLLDYFDYLFKSENDSKIIRIKNLLNEIEKLFSDEKFIVYLQTGLFKELMQPRLIKIIESLKVLVDDFNDNSFIKFLENKINIAMSTENDFEPLDIEKIKTDFIFLYNFLDEFINPEKDISKFIALINSYLHADITRVQMLLDNMNKTLDDFISGLDEKESAEIIKAAKLWKEQFTYLNSFQKEENTNILRNVVKKMLIGVQRTSPILLGGYSLIRKVMELEVLNKINNSEVVGWRFLLADHSIRFLMFPVYFLKRLNELKKNMAITVMNDNLLEVPAMLQGIMMEFMEFYLDPNFILRRQVWPLRAFYRTGSAWLYYTLVKNRRSNFKWWDSNYQGMRRAVWFSVRDGYNVLADLFESLSYKKIENKKIEKIKNNTLGLIKPELISFAMNTAAPLLARKYFNKTGIANLSDEDIFANEYFGQHFLDWNYVGHKAMQETEDGKPKKFIGDKNFIENRILGYLALNIGFYLGKKFTAKNIRPIKSLIAKSTNGIYKGLSKIGLVEKINIDFSDEIRREIKENIEVLWSDQEDPILLMARPFFFSFLKKLKIMTQLEIDEFEEEITHNQLDEVKVTAFVEKIVTFITDKILINMGAGVGVLASLYFTNKAAKKYGPFYPKIANFFA